MNKDLTHKKISPPFSYYGSKNRLTSKILELVPPHNAWVEAFCGSAAITLAKTPAPIEIINDLDDQIINLFNQLRNNPNELIRLVDLTPYSREEYHVSLNISIEDSPIEAARKFLIKTMMAVNGAYGETQSGFSYSQSYARNGMEARVNRWNNLPEKLSLAAKRLKRVRIEKMDARELLKMFSRRPATLVYLDPPYLTNRSVKYRIDANDNSFHEELLQICNKSICMILISGYNSDLYNDYLTKKNGWYRYEFEVTTRDTKGIDYLRKEIIWQNDPCFNALSSNDPLINLTPTELKYNKINPER
jgi:DNA adenine methylase